MIFDIKVMEIDIIQPSNKIHPHKFTLWVGIGSIVMMFAGLTSAYIVKRNQANWQTFEIPVFFWYSTIVILLSSISVQLSVNACKKRQMDKYARLMTITLLLGVLFIVTQCIAFRDFWNAGMTLQANVSFSFLYVIVGLHALHVIGGVIALTVMTLKAFSTTMKNDNVVPVEVISTYWHFVDMLWIYLLVFLWMIK
jgi:cytochrome c oxidase subunit 3